MELVVTKDFLLLLAPPILALAFLFLSWTYSLSTRGARLIPSDKKLLFYGFFFMLGALYTDLLAARLRGHDDGWLDLAICVCWGLLIGFIAWWRYWRSRGASPLPNWSRAQTIQGILIVCLLVGLVGTARGPTQTRSGGSSSVRAHLV